MRLQRFMVAFAAGLVMVAGAAGAGAAFPGANGLIAFERDSQIYVMSADGSSQTRLTDHSGMDRFPSWQPRVGPEPTATPAPTATPTRTVIPAPTPTFEPTAEPTATVVAVALPETDLGDVGRGGGSAPAWAIVALAVAATVGVAGTIWRARRRLLG